MDAIKLEHIKYSYEEYLELEAKSDVRHEYYYGEIFAMAGTSKQHNMIVFNCRKSFDNILKGSKCKIFSEEIKVNVKSQYIYLYPDVVVTCSDKEDDDLSVNFPTVIVEVLSDSTSDYDRREKFNLYKQIPTLQCYILIEQKSYAVECFTKVDDKWYQNIYLDLNEMLEIVALQILIPLSSIYENIDLVINKPIFEKFI